jgi:integrase/recombinase XerD
MLNAKLARECKRLGLKRITTHSFRHAAATHLLRSGAGIRAVQAFLGHKRIGCTQRYTHVVTEDLKEVLASFHPREALR